jgi:hypothetical protein
MSEHKPSNFPAQSYPATGSTGLKTDQVGARHASYRTMPPHVDFESGRDDDHCAGYVQPQPVRHLMAFGVLLFRDLIARVILHCPRLKQSAESQRVSSSDSTKTEVMLAALS